MAPPKAKKQDPHKTASNHSNANNAAQGANVTPKVQLFGNWTGKVPATLLNEHCQKAGWEKPIYNFSQKGKGHECKIVIRQLDPKTREEERIEFHPPGMTFESQQLAKHSCATYVLHRIMSHKNIKTLLPPSQRDLWSEFQTAKDDMPAEKVTYHYAPNPFVARAAKRKEADNPTNHVQHEPWLKYPVLHIQKDLRDRLETLIRANINDAMVPMAKSNTDAKPRDRENTEKSLLRKGFRKQHVEEAMEYHLDMASAMDWLCIHVPEDDLPEDMRPSDPKSFLLQKHTQSSLARDYAIERLMMSGYARISCEEHYTKCDENEYLALQSLCHELGGIEVQAIVEEFSHEERTEMITEEREVLESIYGESVKYELGSHGTKFTVELDIVGQVVVVLPHTSTYPNEIPGVSIMSAKLPAYIKLGIIKQVISDALNFVGSPMVFSLISAVEESSSQLIENPPKLISLRPKTSAIAFDKPEARKSKTRAKGKRNGISNDEERNLKLKEYEEKKMKGPEYTSMLTTRKKLPSYLYKETICQSLSGSQCIIICGETGCGKSTQLGQFILEDMILGGRGSLCNIICTQPRRISAISLAERVAAERAEKVGMQVGYSIRGESKQSADTKLLFCTTGVLLRMMQEDTTLGSVSHVIIDEVHERGVESDFLLILLRDLMAKRKDIQVVLMSATIDADFVSRYFGGCPVIEIPGFTYPVTDYYLEDILDFTQYTPDNLSFVKKNDIGEDVDLGDNFMNKLSFLPKSTIGKLLQNEKDPRFTIDYGLISRMVEYICENNESGAILIFLPGVMEIKKCIDRIKGDCSRLSNTLEIFPLHSALTSAEQSAVFRKMKPGKRKVVVSTNIAETSVTINDVVFVIDSGRVKEMQLVNSILSLTEIWASRAACKQRRGRAGRVQPGIVYKLYTSHFESKVMRKNLQPEILRLPLEQICLQIKSMGIVDVQKFLAKALSPPSPSVVQDAIDLLENLNALDPVSGLLSPLGKHISLIPTDIRVAKMLLFGAIFHCLDPILTIAACMSGKTPFNSPMDKRDEAKEAQKVFNRFKCDYLMICAAFDAWKSEGKHGGRRAQHSFCESHFMSMMTLTSMLDLRKRFKEILSDLGYLSNANWDLANSNAENEKIVKSVILAGLYPNVASIRTPKQQYDQTAEGAVAIAAKSSEIHFFIKKDGRVFIHPSSILFSEQKYDESVLVYGSKVATSKIFLRLCTVAPSIALFLLGGKLQVIQDGRAVAIDDIRFQAFPRISTLVTGMRRLLDIVLQEKVNNPATNVIDSEIGALCLDLLAS